MKKIRKAQNYKYEQGSNFLSTVSNSNEYIRQEQINNNYFENTNYNINNNYNHNHNYDVENSSDKNIQYSNKHVNKPNAKYINNKDKSKIQR